MVATTVYAIAATVTVKKGIRRRWNTVFNSGAWHDRNSGGRITTGSFAPPSILMEELEAKERERADQCHALAQEGMPIGPGDLATRFLFFGFGFFF